MNPSKNKDKKIMGIILITLTVYALTFIFRTSFNQDGRYYFCLFDDAMISMTYAKNLIDGYGLNWARFGDPVEGFTHPLWMLMMVPVNLLPVNDAIRSLFVQFLSLCFLMATIVYLRKLYIRNFSANTNLWIVPVILTASYYPLNHWSLQGMETAFQSFLIIAGFHQSFKIFKHPHHKDFIKLGYIIAAALLLRMDMAIPLFFISIPLLFHLRSHLSSILKMALIVAIPVLGYLIFRIMYFHDILPNTYYLKLANIPADIRILRGFETFRSFFIPVLIPFVLVTLILIGRIRDLRLMLMLAFVIVQFAYNIYVGGDAWEWSSVGANRFIVIAMPVFFILCGVALEIFLSFIQNLKQGYIRNSIITLVCILFIAWFNGLVLNNDRTEKFRNLVLVNRPLHVDYHRDMIRKVNLLNKLAKEDAIVATIQAGVCSYFGHFRLTDIMGYNDAFIARGKPYFELSKKEYQKYVPGHVKLNYSYTINSVKPDIIYDTWGVDKPAVRNEFYRLTRDIYMENEYGWLIRKGSKKVRSVI